MSGFRKFILRGNVVDLAVAVVIGAAFGAVGGVPDFLALAFTVNGSRFAVGEFINALLSFLIIAAVVYFFVVIPVGKLMDRYKGEEPVGPRTRECPHCLSKIPQAASRCAFCTQEVPTADVADRVAAGRIR